MQRFPTSLAVFLVLVLTAAAQQPKPLIAKVRPGEARTYFFEQDLRIKSTVEPQFQDVPGLKPTNRAHRISGQLLVSYDARDTAIATLRLQELKLLSADTPESQRSAARWLRDMGSRTITLRWPPHGAPDFKGMEVTSGDELDTSATQMLQMMIVTILDPNVSKRPVKPGDRWAEPPDEPGESPTHNWYQRDVNVAGQSCALLMIEGKQEGRPERFELAPDARAAGVQGTSRSSLHMIGAGFFDHQAERVAMVKSAVTSETVVGVVASDRDAEVRVPVRVMSVVVDVDTVTWLSRPELPPWHAELVRETAAVDLKPGAVMASRVPVAPTPQPAAAGAAAPSESLGDVARRAREAKAKKPN